MIYGPVGTSSIFDVVIFEPGLGGRVEEGVGDCLLGGPSFSANLLRA